MEKGLEHAFFYGSENHDRVYNTNSMEHWLKRFFTTGVFAGDFQVLSNGDMTVKLKGGYVNIGGKVKVYQEEQDLRLETAHASYDRIDSIVLELNDPDRDIFVRVVTGGYSSSPSPLVPIRENGVDQRVVAQILVRHGVVRITQADITDTRANQELCGIVAGTVKEMDFGQFQSQFDSYFRGYKADIAAEFQNWFDSVKNQVTGDMAVRLQEQIEDMHQQLTAYTNQKIADLINGAPESLDTLKEVANVIAEHKTVMDALDAAIGKKANAAEFDSHVKDAVKHLTTAERNKWNAKMETTGDSANNTVTFTSGDAANPTGWADVGVIASGEKHSSLWRKFSLAVKNVRYLYKVLTSGALSTLLGNNLTANRAVVANGSGKLAAAGVTSTELGYLAGAKSKVQDQIDALNTHLQAIGSWEDITGSCNLGYVPDSWGNVYKNIKLRMVVFYIGANSVNNQSPILGIGQLPGDATVKVIGIASCSTSGVSVDIKNDRYIVRSSHSQDGPILDPRYLGIALF